MWTWKLGRVEEVCGQEFTNEWDQDLLYEFESKLSHKNLTGIIKTLFLVFFTASMLIKVKFSRKKHYVSVSRA